MTTRQFFPVLLAALLVSAGIALLFSGVARAQTTDTAATSPEGEPVLERRGTPNDTTAAKLDKLDTRRATIEAQRTRALAGLAEDDPRRSEIDAIYDAKLAQVDRKQTHFEMQGEHLATVPGAVHREARGDNRLDRPDTARSRRPDKVDRPGRHGRG